MNFTNFIVKIIYMPLDQSAFSTPGYYQIYYARVGKLPWRVNETFGSIDI